VSTPTPLEELLTAASAEVNMAGRSRQVSVRVFERYVSELVQLLQQERELARLRAQDHDDQVARLNNRLRARRTRATAQLARRGLPPTTFPMLVCGAELRASAVIYGLVDPREPARVRYVGQAVNAEARMAGHLNGRSRPPRPMEAWLTALRTEGVTPDMVLLERVPRGADLDACERYWIHAMRDRGMADLNTAIPKRGTEA
jgi:hypothetical protein